MIAFVGNGQNRQIYRNRKLIVAAGGRGVGHDWYGKQGFFSGGCKCSKVNGGDGFTTGECSKNHGTARFEMTKPCALRIVS